MSLDFNAAIDQLNQRIYLPGGTAFVVNIIVLQSLMGIILLLTLVSLFIRFWNGSVWIVRLVRPNNNSDSKFKFISINPIMVWLFFSGGFSIIAQFYLYNAYTSTRIGTNLYNAFLWRSSIWTALFLAAWSIAWSTFIQPIISLTRPQNDSKWNLARYPVAINIFFTLVPTLFLLGAFVIGIRANNHWNDIFTIYLELHADLKEAAGLASPSLSLLLKIQNELLQINAVNALLIPVWQKIWQVSALFVFLEMAIFASSSFIYLTSLSNALGSLPDQASRRALHSTYNSLKLTTIATLSIEILFFGVDLFCAINAASITNNLIIAEWVLVGALWIFAVLGFMIELSLLIRSITAARVANEAAASTFSNVKSRQQKFGVSVHREVATVIDTGEEYEIELQESAKIRKERAAFEMMYSSP